MSDFDIPDLPSDEELGLSKEEVEALEKELGDDDGPEMSPDELEAFLGQSSGPPPAIDIPKPKKIPDPAPAKAPPPPPKAPAQAPPAGGPKGDEKRPPAAEKPADEKAPPKEKKPRPRPAQTARSSWRGPVTLLLLLVAAFAASSRTGLPRPVPANAPASEFSSARAMSMLVEMTRVAHPTGSPYHAEVRDYVVGRLRALGYEPEIQTTTSVRARGPRVRAATVRNIAVRIPGTASTGAVLATAHYDSRVLARGAGDDASGVVAILESLRALQEGEPLRNDLIVLITDAEELGLLGAHAFVDEHPWMDDVRVVLSFELRGGGGPAQMFETNEQSGWVVRGLQASRPGVYANSVAFEIYRRMGRDTDFTPFKEAGIQGLNFAAIDNAHVYHQEYDSPENLDERTLQYQGLNVLQTVRHFGGEDLSVVEAPDAVYLAVPFVGLIVYDAKWVLPITGGLLLLLVMGTALAVRGGWGPLGIVVGILTSLAGTAASVGAASWLVGWIDGRHPEAGSMMGSELHSEGWYVVALVAAAFTIVTALHGVVRRWFRWQELALGAAVIPLAAAVALSIYAPLGAMDLQWPIAAVMIASIAMLLLTKNADGPVGWVLALLMALPVLVVLLPLTEGIWLAMSIRLATVVVGLSVTAIYLCLPALDSLRHPNAWWAPLTGALVASGAFGIGLTTAATTPERPAPSTLVYAYEHGADAGLWATDPLTDSVDLPAREWAIERVQSAFGGRTDLAGFGYLFGEVPTTEAPAVTVPAPTVDILSDDPLPTGRRVTLSVRSQIGAELVVFHTPDPASTHIVSVNGKPIPTEQPVEWLEHWGVPDSTIVVELEVASAGEPALEIVEHHLRPEDLLGGQFFHRSDHFTPDDSRQSDRAMIRYAPFGTTGAARSDGAARPEATAAAAGDSASVVIDTSSVAEPDTTVAQPDTAAADTTAADTTTADAPGRHPLTTPESRRR